MKHNYKEIEPHYGLRDFIHSFWSHENITDEAQQLTIIPDSFFKIVFYVSGGKVISYFLTGIWTEAKEVVIPPRTSSFGCRLNILAPEYLLGREVRTVFQSVKQLDSSFLNIKSLDLSDFDTIVEQWQKELLNIRTSKAISANKQRLSQLLYKVNGLATASEISEQIFWTQRQINRYLNQYLGVSLKQYLNIQKAYITYKQIREGEFYPQKGYYDQAHFIREIKKHTGQTPTSLFKNQNDQFIQLKNIRYR